MQTCLESFQTHAPHESDDIDGALHQVHPLQKTAPYVTTIALHKKRLRGTKHLRRSLITIQCDARVRIIHPSTMVNFKTVE